MAAPKCFAKMDARLDSHPKIRRGGRNAREVFLFVLRRRRLVDKEAGDGHVSAADVDPWYLADQLMMTEAEAADGLARAIAVKLLAETDDGVEIVGWDTEWGMGPMTEAERKQLQRSKSRDKGSVQTAVTDAGTRPDTVRTVSGQDVTGPDSHASEKIREDQIRQEELSPARSGGDGEVGTPAPAVAPPPPAPDATPPAAPTPAPVIRDRHQQVLTGAWAYHRERFLALQADGIAPNAIAPNAIAMGSAEVELSKRIHELREKRTSYDEIATKLKHRIDVGEAECRREGHVNWFGSTNTWSFGPFWRALDSSVEQARVPKPKTAAAARASPRAIGPCPPSINHPVSSQLEDIA